MRPLLLVCLLAALAGPSAADTDPLYQPRGPGAVFPTVEAAAVDGLAHAHRVERRSQNSRLSRGGVIRAVPGGFTYDALVAASEEHPDELTLVLAQDVVAHFHTYPRQNPAIDRTNEAHSAEDRAIVDELDRLGRPSYVLTPSLRIVGYYGRDARAAVPRAVRAGRVPSEVMVATLRSGAGAALLAASN
ncbi:MAG: hypothetical protein KC560_01390 [Myxococcales bacterium]|nr:hypothetical protein [Myxococcales bacterium]